MSVAVPDFDKLFRGSSSIKIPGIDMSDSQSSDDSNIKSDDEYVPKPVRSPAYNPEDVISYTPQMVRMKSPTPPSEVKKTPPKRRNSIATTEFKRPPPKRERKRKLEDDKEDKPRKRGKDEKKEPPKETKPESKPKSQVKEKSKVKPKGKVTFEDEHPPVEIRENLIMLTRMFKKNTFEVNLQIPVKFFKNVMPIFHKNIKLDLFVQRENSENLWSNVNVKSADTIKTPVAIYKIVNVDDSIIDNLRISMNNNVENFKEPILSEKSDKNCKIYNESGVIRFGGSDQSIYSNARIELKKNLTYVFELSLNVIFARRYVNVQAEHYRCTMCSREDNNFLACVVIAATDNCTIENGVKLMHNTLASN